MVNNSITFFCFDDIDGIVDHHCWNFLLFWWYWWNCWPSLFKLSFLLFWCYWWNCWPSLFQLFFVVNISINIFKAKESLNSDGQQFHQNHENKRKFKQWWSTILSTFFCFDDIDGIVDHHCLNCLLFWWYWWNCWPSLFKLSFVFMILMELKKV
jgi:hypothetical protein